MKLSLIAVFATAAISFSAFAGEPDAPRSSLWDAVKNPESPEEEIAQLRAQVKDLGAMVVDLIEVVNSQAEIIDEHARAINAQADRIDLLGMRRVAAPPIITPYAYQGPVAPAPAAEPWKPHAKNHDADADQRAADRRNDEMIRVIKREAARNRAQRADLYRNQVQLDSFPKHDDYDY